MTAMITALQHLSEGHGLSADEAAAMMCEIIAGQATRAQIGALLVCLRLRASECGTRHETHQVQCSPDV